MTARNVKERSSIKTGAFTEKGSENRIEGKNLSWHPVSIFVNESYKHRS